MVQSIIEFWFKESKDSEILFHIESSLPFSPMIGEIIETDIFTTIDQFKFDVDDLEFLNNNDFFIVHAVVYTSISARFANQDVIVKKVILIPHDGNY